MKAEFVRGGNTFVIEEAGVYYLVNTDERSVLKARPAGSPAMFLKFGYFEDAEDTSEETLEEIKEIYSEHAKEAKTE